MLSHHHIISLAPRCVCVSGCTCVCLSNKLGGGGGLIVRGKATLKLIASTPRHESTHMHAILHKSTHIVSLATQNLKG